MALTYDTRGYANNVFGGNGSNQVIVVTNDLSTRHTFLSMIDYATANGPSFEVGCSLPGFTNLFDVGVNDVSAGCDNDGTSNVNKLNDTTSFVPVPGAWYNAVVIYHRGSVQVFVNGSLISSKTGTGTLANLCSASNVVVGGWWVSDPIGVSGKLDNVRLYNRVLNSHEVAALAANYQVTSTDVRRGGK